MDAETFSLAISSMKALSAHVSFTRTYQSPVSLSKTNEQQKKQKIRFFINIVRKTHDREEETEIRIQVSTRAALRNLARDVLLEKCLNGRFDSLRVKQRVSVEDVLITYEKKNQKRESADEANAGNNEAGSEEPSRGVIMDKDASLYSLVDAKIELCWPGNRLWYKAEVLSLDARARVAEVLFPAGDVETVELDEIINEGRLNVCARDAVPLTPKNLVHSEPFTDKNKKTQEEVQAPLIVVTKRQQIPNREGDCLSCGRTDSHRWYKKRSQCHNCYNRERRILNRTDETRNQCSFCETRLTSEWYHDKFSEDGSLLKTGRRRMLCHSCYNAALAKSQDKQCDECKSTETGGSWYTGQGAAGGGRGICLCNMCYRRKLALFNKSDDLDDSVTQDGVSKKQYFCGQCGKMSFKLGTTAETGALVKSQVHENMRICRACYDKELNQRKLDGLPVKGQRPQDLKRENFLQTNPFDII